MGYQLVRYNDSEKDFYADYGLDSNSVKRGFKVRDVVTQSIKHQTASNSFKDRSIKYWVDAMTDKAITTEEMIWTLPGTLPVCYLKCLKVTWKGNDCVYANGGFEPVVNAHVCVPDMIVNTCSQMKVGGQSWSY